ncbi:hypothetical protein DMC01_12770 [Campylobacter troglodytis]|nr:hypothetical protein DMC01_12770 [Campylobacter troglodytis]
MSKIICYIIMCITWFVSYIACSIILEFCLDVINFMMDRDFYNLKRFPTVYIGITCVLLNPFCIVCFECFKFLREKLINALIFSAINAVLFIGVRMVWLNGASHNAYLLSLVFLLSIVAFIKLHLIYRNKILEFVTISVCEFGYVYLYLSLV